MTAQGVIASHTHAGQKDLFPLRLLPPRGIRAGFSEWLLSLTRQSCPGATGLRAAADASVFVDAVFASRAIVEMMGMIIRVRMAEVTMLPTRGAAMRSLTLTNTGAVVRRNREQVNDGGDGGHHLEGARFPS